MKKYIVGARNNENDAYSVVIQTDIKLIASFFLFLTRPLVNEIEMVEAKDVLMTKKRSPIADDEYTHLHGEDNESCKGTGMTRAFWLPPGKENVIVFGTPNSGKVHHPQDNLKPCSCGCKERPLLMYEKDELYYCGGATDSVFAICSVCGRHTKKSNILSAIENWNNDFVSNILEG